MSGGSVEKRLDNCAAQICASELHAEMPGGVATHKDVAIVKAVNGWIIRVGCKTFVTTDWDFLQRELKEYYDNPIKAEGKWSK